MLQQPLNQRSHRPQSHSGRLWGVHMILLKLAHCITLSYVITSPSVGSISISPFGLRCTHWFWTFISLLIIEIACTLAMFFLGVPSFEPPQLKVSGKFSFFLCNMVHVFYAKELLQGHLELTRIGRRENLRVDLWWAWGPKKIMVFLQMFYLKPDELRTAKHSPLRPWLNRALASEGGWYWL